MRIRAAAVWALALSVLLLSAGPASADVGDYLGKTIAAVTIERDGRIVDEPRLLNLVETHQGQALRMAEVRESITHLFSLGRFEDVIVRAEARGDSVALTYVLVQIPVIVGVSFAGTGAPGIDEGRLRRVIAERYGASPRVGRSAEMAQLVEDNLREVGYLRAHVDPRTESVGGARERLVFAVTPGERARIATINVSGDPGMSESEFLRSLQISPGVPFQREALNGRLDRYLAGKRSQGYYAVRASYSPALTNEDRTVALAINVQLGQRVRVTFAGDALPSDRRDDLVPAAREGSADEDLLEDSSNRIEDYLRAQGYREATAPHTRQEVNGDLVVTFTVTKGPQYRVGRVDFSGNMSFSLTDLQPRLRVHPGQPFSESAMTADTSIIEDFYRRAGFASVDVTFRADTPPPSGGSVDVPIAIQVQVNEGVRTLVNSVKIDAGAAVSEPSLRSSLGLQPGQAFSASQLASDADAIDLRLANLGYPNASVGTNPGMSADGTRADVVFTVREGPQVFVDHVLIVGNDRTRTATIERELQFKSGDPLALEAVNESQRRLAALGLFRRARITELRHGDESKRDILVAVEEAPVTTVGYGGGIEAGERLNTDSNTGVASQQLEVAPRAFFEVGRRNLFGKNRSINLFTSVSIGSLQSQTTTKTGLGFGEYRVIGTYREPKVFGTSADAFLTGTLEQQRRSSFNFARRALNAEVGRRLSRTVSVSGSYQIQRTELFDERIDPAFKTPIDRVFPQFRLSSFSTSIVRDTRDDLTDPADGRFLSANGQIAGRRIGSELGFAKSFLTAQMFHVVPHTTRTVLAASARLGVATGFPRIVPDVDENGDPKVLDGKPVFVSVRKLPASERFFAGGDTTVRGFALDQLGTAATIDKDGFPTGGGGLVVLNLELRAPVFGGFGVVGFADAGNVFLYTSDINLGRLRGALGFGVRYKSPIGPIRVDLGFKVHRHEIAPGKRESLTALHISLGQAF